MRQQRRGSRLHIHADAGHAAFHHAGERVLQLGLFEIMLILPHADGLRVDLHQFGKRVLHAPRDGNRASERNVVFRKFLCRKFGSRVDARARLADDDVSHARRFRQQGRDELFALAGSRAVADGDSRDLVAADHAQNLRFCSGLLRLVVRQGEIAHARLQNPARLIHNRQLAARAETRIDAQRHLTADRRLHQQLMQVVAEDADRALVRLVRQFASDFAFKRRADEPAPRVLRRRAHHVAAGAARPDHRTADDLHRLLVVAFYRDFQPFFAFAAVDGQNAVSRRAQNRFAVIRILRVNAFALFGGDRTQHARAAVERAQIGADRRIVADLLGEDILRQLNGSFRVGHAFFFAHIRLRQRERVVPAPLGKNQIRQRLNALFLGDHRAGAALLLIRAVDILQLGERRRSRELLFQIAGHFSLFRNRSGNLFPALIQPAQIVQPLADFAQLLVIHRAGHFLAVSGDKGNGVALVDQRNNFADDRGRGLKFA